MRLIDMQMEMFDQLGYGDAKGSPDDRLMARFTRALNNGYKEVFARKGLSKLRMLNAVPFNCVANTPFCVLPYVARQIISIQDRVNQWDFTPTSLQDLRLKDPGLTLRTDFPDEYVVLNYMAPVARDPSAADHVYVVSTSTLDSGGPTAYIQAVLSNNYPRNLNQNLTGTVALDFDATVATITQLRKFYLSAPGKGDIVLTQTNGAGTELARIPAGRTMARYTRLHLYPQPSQVNTYYADIELMFEPLVNPNDEPLIPDDFDYIVPARALMREFLKRGKTAQYQLESSRFEKGMAGLLLHLNSQGGSASREPRGYSQLGAMFPDGS